MKKILAIGVLALGFGSVAIAEESGVFVGAELGFANVQATANATSNPTKVDIKTNAAHYGFKVGYKHFFAQNMGVRAYGAFANSSISVNEDGVNAAGVASSDTTTANFNTITANADFLFNFHSVDSADVGAFVGIGLGMLSANYSEKAIPTQSPSGLYADVKLGIRANVAKNHGIDFIVKIPFTEVEKAGSINGVNVNFKMKQNLALSLGYNYSF